MLEKAREYFGESLVDIWGKKMLKYISNLRSKPSKEYTDNRATISNRLDMIEDEKLQNNEGIASYSFLRLKIQKLEEEVEWEIILEDSSLP